MSTEMPPTLAPETRAAAARPSTPVPAVPGDVRIAFGIALLAFGSASALQLGLQIAQHLVSQDEPETVVGMGLVPVIALVAGFVLLTVGRARRRNAIARITRSHPVDAAHVLTFRRRTATAALVFAFVALAYCSIGLLGLLTWVPAIAAIVLGAIALGRRRGGFGFALTAVIAGSLALLLGFGAVGSGLDAMSSRASAATVETSAAAAATASPAHENRYLESAADAMIAGAGVECLDATARQQLHDQIDQDMLRLGYLLCRGFAKGQHAGESLGHSMIGSLRESAASETSARQAAKMIALAAAEDLCPAQQATAAQVAAAL